MKKEFLLLFIILLHSKVCASDVVVDGISYNVNLSTMEATVVSGDYNFRDIIIPESFSYNGRSFTVVTIGEYAFNRDSSKSLTSLKISKTIKNIEEHAFGVTNHLKKIVIPNSVEKIRAFNYFCATDSIIFEDSESSLEFVYHKNSKISFFKTKYIYFGRSIKSIQYGAVTWEMPFWGLAGCNEIETIEYGNAVINPLKLTYDVGYHNIYGMESLRTIILGANIDNMFEGVDVPTIESIICKSDNPRGFDPSNKFTNNQYMNINVYIPKGDLNKYANTEGWKNFFNLEEVKVEIAPTVKSKITLEKGKTVTLKATVTPMTLPDKSVTWKSSNTKVATVTSKGKVKGVKAGTATITCTSNATGTKATCKVTVGYVKLGQTEAVVKKGKTITLTPTVYPSSLTDKSVTWESSNTAVATVSSDGKVKGVKTGSATITCTSNATGLSTTCEVLVGNVVLNKYNATLQKGKTLTLKATIYPSSLEDKSVTWESSNTKVATVSSTGKVKGIKAGTATITCTSVATGLSTICTVTVTATSSSRSLEGDDTDVTGIESIDEQPALAEPYDVYDLSGRKVRHQVTSLDGLPDGIYIVNGRKILKK